MRKPDLLNMAKRKPYLCFIASAFCVVLLACTDLCCGPLGLRELVEENQPIRVECQFCDHVYEFSPQELKTLLETL